MPGGKPSEGPPNTHTLVAILGSESRQINPDKSREIREKSYQTGSGK